jgi:hypothetical protein
VEPTKHTQHIVEYGRAHIASLLEFIHHGERISQAAVHPPSRHTESTAHASAAAHAHSGGEGHPEGSGLPTRQERPGSCGRRLTQVKYLPWGIAYALH